MNPHGRWMLRLLLWHTLFLAIFSADAGSKQRPNVIIVITDDQGYGDLSCHGNPVLKTPNLDRLHKESIRLTDFHAAPMCTPTRGQLMTGIDALRNGAMNVSSGRTSLRREFPTMAEIFASNDYQTGLFGKWHLGDNYPYRPQDRGFQETIWFPSSHTPSAPDFWNNDYFDDVYSHNGIRKQFKGYCTDAFFNEAMRWMHGAGKKRKPFFCYLALNAPHAPLFVPDKYREPYRHLKPEIASFYGMIANIDENVGKLETFLGQNGLRENTILIFLTDNGTAGGETIFNAGMRGKKISLHEGGHRVPFFLRWPSGLPGRSGDVHWLAQSQDVLPTLIDLCELKKPRSARFDGMSLATALREPNTVTPDRMLVAQFSRMNAPEPTEGDAVVMWRKWRLVSQTELYDLSKDPGQTNNVIEQRPEIAQAMRKHYAAWWKGVAPRVNEFSPIHVGSREEPQTLLTPCDWKDVFLDQQAQVRRVQRNGVWELFAERSGEYEFEVRRWPVEADLPIVAAAPEYKAVDGNYRAGLALPISEVRIKAGSADLTAPVSTNDHSKTLSIYIKKGTFPLQTWFLDKNGQELCGAYYVYVRRR